MFFSHLFASILLFSELQLIALNYWFLEVKDLLPFQVLIILFVSLRMLISFYVILKLMNQN